MTMRSQRWQPPKAAPAAAVVATAWLIGHAIVVGAIPTASCETLDQTDGEDVAATATAAAAAAAAAGSTCSSSALPLGHSSASEERIPATDEPTAMVTTTTTYELLEPLHLELGVGGKVRYAVDYAYSPVVGRSSSSNSVLLVQSSNEMNAANNEVCDELNSDDASSMDLVTEGRWRNGEVSTEQCHPNDVLIVSTSTGRVSDETTRSTLMKRQSAITIDPAAATTATTIPTFMTTTSTTLLVRELWKWWQWWIPWHTWHDERHAQHQKVYCFSTKYKLHPGAAFAGGSHGEVWKGQQRNNVAAKPESDSKTAETSSKSSSRANDPPGTKRRDDTRQYLIFKRLHVDRGYRTLEAGLREVYFGKLLLALEQGNKVGYSPDKSQQHDSDEALSSMAMFTQYVDHFFGESDGELWIVFRDAGPSLRSFLYFGSDTGDFVVYQHSWLWTLMRMSLRHANREEGIQKQHTDSIHKRSNSDNPMGAREAHPMLSGLTDDTDEIPIQPQQQPVVDARFGSSFLNALLRQILTAAKTLHENGIVHRDIKPANIMCQTNVDLEQLQSSLSWDIGVPSLKMHCVLGDYSSAWDDYTRHHLYTRGPSRLEQTDEYAPPEAIFGYIYNVTSQPTISPSFDSWSIGIVALELLLGTPNVFSVDQRTRMVLSHKMQKQGATPQEIERAMYLAALSHFCIYNPSKSNKPDWPLRSGDPLHRSAMTKQSCTLQDFHRALRARDPLGWGFESSDDTLLHLIWQLLAWDPNERITASQALNHPYFSNRTTLPMEKSDPTPGEHNALESQMLDPRMDFNVTDSIDEFRCPQCGRVFADWKSCHSHANARKHAKFCTYDTTTLPTCLNAHAMLPAHSSSGYCDIQGRRRTIEDFHAIHLLPFQQFYGIFDGHLGNFASKYAASFLYDEMTTRLPTIPAPAEACDESPCNDNDQGDWKSLVKKSVHESFSSVHEKFLQASRSIPQNRFMMDQSGTTATALLVTNASYVIASIGDSRAVLSSRKTGASNHNSYLYRDDFLAVPLTTDHVASNPVERNLVQSRGGRIVRHKSSGVDRVNGTLIVTRSIGDAGLAPWLSRQPDVVILSRKEITKACYGDDMDNSSHPDSDPKRERKRKKHEADSEAGDNTAALVVPCFMILASDGLWDTVSNQEAVDLVAQVFVSSSSLLTAGDAADASNSSRSTTTYNEDMSIKSTGTTATNAAVWQQAAEALTLEAYVRGSTDNIGVCVVAVDG